jgi:hypothetical protein
MALPREQERKHHCTRDEGESRLDSERCAPSARGGLKERLVTPPHDSVDPSPVPNNDCAQHELEQRIQRHVRNIGMDGGAHDARSGSAERQFCRGVHGQ